MVIFMYFIYLKLSVHICKTADYRRTIAGTNTQSNMLRPNETNRR